MDRQTTKILKWLKQKLGDKPISPYEVNVRTTNILFHLAEYNETRDSDTSLVIEDLKLKTKETIAIANDRKELLLESIGPLFTSFSRTPSSYLNVLVECALVLDLKNTSLTSYALAINDLTTSLGEAELKNKQLENELVRLSENFTQALELNKSLERDLDKVEGQFAEKTKTVKKRIEDVHFLTNKKNETDNRLKMAEEELSARGMDSSLTHSSLMDLSKKLEKLSEESEQLNAKKKSYMDLSPNIAYAELQLEAARKEAAALDAEQAEKVAMLSGILSWDFNRQQT